MTATWRAEPSPIPARVEALDALPLAPLATPAAAPIRVLAQCCGRLFLLPLTLALTLTRALWCRYQAASRDRQAVEVEGRLLALAYLAAEANRRGHWAAWAEAEERMASERRYWAFLRRAERGWLAKARRGR